MILGFTQGMSILERILEAFLSSFVRIMDRLGWPLSSFFIGDVSIVHVCIDCSIMYTVG